MPLFSFEGREPVVSPGAWIAPTATLVGDVRVEEEASIWYGAVIRADFGPIIIRRGANIQDGSVLHVDPGFPMTLGRMVSIGHKVMLHGCTIGDGSLIGINSVVMNGARIGKGSLIGANTLITEGKEIPDGVLVLGAPGKIVRSLTQEDKDYLLGIARGYVERSKVYRQNLRAQ